MSGGALVTAPLVAHPARGADRVGGGDFSSAVVAGGVPAGWELKEKTGKADLAVIEDGEVSAARLRSANTSFYVQKGVRGGCSPARSRGWVREALQAGTLGKEVKEVPTLEAFQERFLDCSVVNNKPRRSTRSAGCCGCTSSLPSLRLVERLNHNRVKDRPPMRPAGAESSKTTGASAP